jgi:hypothetical protein
LTLRTSTLISCPNMSPNSSTLLKSFVYAIIYLYPQLGNEIVRIKNAARLRTALCVLCVRGNYTMKRRLLPGREDLWTFTCNECGEGNIQCNERGASARNHAFQHSTDPRPPRLFSSTLPSHFPYLDRSMPTSTRLRQHLQECGNIYRPLPPPTLRTISERRDVTDIDTQARLYDGSIIDCSKANSNVEVLSLLKVVYSPLDMKISRWIDRALYKRLIEDIERCDSTGRLSGT